MPGFIPSLSGFPALPRTLESQRISRFVGLALPASPVWSLRPGPRRRICCFGAASIAEADGISKCCSDQGIRFPSLSHAVAEVGLAAPRQVVVASPRTSPLARLPPVPQVTWPVTFSSESPLARKKLPPHAKSSSKQLPDGFSEHDPGAWVQLAPPEPGAFPPDDSSGVDDSFNETSILELGAKVFPSLPPDLADTAWRRFLKNANICIKHYNTKYHADFVYKHVVESGLFLLGEQDSKMYFHINFYAHDSKGHSHLFFGEIRVRVAPKEEDVSCCQPVSNSDAGGKSLRTIEDMRKATFPIWGTAGVDREHCYGCPSEMRHPAGTCYVAGHVADSRHYFVP
ncbi:hypothetical protein U9M48_025649 [Paspalum notatum var. saurae]|uniref:DUF3615 domain-containing protein n=1 Tax=Paspalum notatum var. saurae TaxID=547442 RepID=A0AAQ3WXB1_PASNO